MQDTEVIEQRAIKLATAVKKVLREQAKGKKPAESDAGNTPKGLPAMGENADETSPEYPTQHLEPKDPGFTGKNIIAGTGTGPAIGSEDQQFSGVT